MEIELKYSASAEQAERILEDMMSESGSEIKNIPMEAVYFDTEDRALRDIRCGNPLDGFGRRVTICVCFK